MHLFVKEHGGKIWQVADPKDDPNRGASTVQFDGATSPFPFDRVINDCSKDCLFLFSFRKETFYKFRIGVFQPKCMKYFTVPEMLFYFKLIAKNKVVLYKHSLSYFCLFHRSQYFISQSNFQQISPRVVLQQINEFQQNI